MSILAITITLYIVIGFQTYPIIFGEKFSNIVGVTYTAVNTVLISLVGFIYLMGFKDALTWVPITIAFMYIFVNTWISVNYALNIKLREYSGISDVFVIYVAYIVSCLTIMLSILSLEDKIK